MKANQSLTSIILLFLVVGIFFVAGTSCKKKSSDPEKPAVPGYVGTWTRIHLGQTLTINIYANGTSTGTWGSIALPNGTYTVTGTQFSFADSGCPQPGTYSFVLSGNVITLTLISDNCDGRYQIVPGTYNRTS